MADVAEITKQAHDAGFEQGSTAAANAIISWFGRQALGVTVLQLTEAWDSGEIALAAGYEPVGGEAAKPSAPPPAILLTPPTMSREQARVSGYTGDVCTNCQALTVKRNGACLVCESCGTTTGCS